MLCLSCVVQGVIGARCQCAGAQAPILDDVSLELPANSLGLVFGRSGAGKTTLLSAVAGLATPSAGGIAIRNGLAAPLTDAVRPL